MKKLYIILTLFVLIATITSCASGRGMAGCSVNARLVGYR
jgi:hypothetical protein